MKRILYIIAALWWLVGMSSLAQINITGLEYWFDDNVQDRTTVAISASSSYELNTNLNTSALPDGLHTFHMRFVDDSLHYSHVESQFFYKKTDSAAAAPLLQTFQYWLNDDVEDAQIEALPATEAFDLLDTLDMSAFPPGLYSLHGRYRDTEGQWSSVSSQFFYYREPVAVMDTNTVETFQYWLNDDFDNNVIEAMGSMPTIDLSDTLDMTAMHEGLYGLHGRYRDARGRWSSITSQFFYHRPHVQAGTNTLRTWRYWFDEHFEAAQTMQVAGSVELLDLSENIDMSGIWKGQHIVHFQFLDSLGQWSSVINDTVTKVAFPIASFGFTTVFDCDSTAVLFSNTSIDGDEYHWDFGNGDTATDSLPSYAYYNPGTYVIGLTVTDTATGRDSTLTTSITILGPTAGAISVTACDSFLSPSGNHTWAVSGTYSDTLTNSIGCDSVLAITLTVNQSTAGAESAESCDNYFWSTTGMTYTVGGTYHDTLTNAAGCDSIATLNLVLHYAALDMQTATACDSFLWVANNAIYTASGTYTDTLMTVHGCDSVVVLSLTVLNSTEGSEMQEACDSYTWPVNGTTYTSSGSFDAVLTNAAGCDSLVTLHLTIRQSSVGTEVVEACHQYIWPATGATYTESGTYQVTLTNAVGCDSNTTLELTVHTVDTAVQRDGIVLTAQTAGAAYQWLDCHDGYAPIAGATAQSFTPSVNGLYAVEITTDACRDTSSCHTVSTIGIVDNSFAQPLRVYPNPTSGYLIIDLGATPVEATYTVRNSAGQVVGLHRERATNRMELNLQGAAGVYLIEVVAGNERAAFRVVKE